MRVAVVGAGPSGFYAAGALLAAGHEVDLLERLPTPWGLVRGGVAPDHPKIKSVTRVFEKIAARPGFRFFGHVEVGRDVTHDELADWYDAVLYAVGTADDRRTGIPGEQLPGSHSATEFVGWYNGHPDYADHAFDLSGRRAVVIGNGNVAIDVARMLTLTHDELAVTDVADHAIAAFAASNIREIVILGRRGPQHAAFTNPELLELGVLADAHVVVDPAQIPHPDGLDAQQTDAKARRNVEILHGYARRERGDARRHVVLRFLASPVEILGEDHVTGVRVVENELAAGSDGRERARPTERTEIIPADIVFRAIGYAGRPLPGLPYDDRSGLIPNTDGRVHHRRRTYVAGWIKRGPSGVIGTNKKCATDTVAALLTDLEAGALTDGGARDAAFVERTLRARVPDLVDYTGWEAIDQAETGAGAAAGRPRVKLTRTEELLVAARRP